MPDRVTWTSPEGTFIDFTDHSAGYVFSGEGTTGLRSPTFEVIASQYAGIDGATVQAVRAAVSNPTVALFVEAENPEAFRVKARALVHAMRPKAGVGRLTVTTEWGDSRSLDCYCLGGLEGDHAPNVNGPGTWWRMVLKLYAPSPWWLGDEQTVTFGLGAPSNFFPFFPLNLSPSSVQGQFSVDLSDADAPAHPLWTVTGPGSDLVLRNETTGKSLSVSHTLLAGESLVIDTRPGYQSVRLTDGTNLMSAVTSDPALWPLIEGRNELSVTLTGATNDSRIVGTYRPRFAGI